LKVFDINKDGGKSITAQNDVIGGDELGLAELKKNENVYNLPQ
jgi:hypothetical protein